MVRSGESLVTHTRIAQLVAAFAVTALLTGVLAVSPAVAGADPLDSDVRAATSAASDTVNITVSPMRQLRFCRDSLPASDGMRKKRMSAAIQVAKVARKQANHSGFRARCGRSLVMTGTGGAKPSVVRAMKKAERRTGLRTHWRSVPNTRKEIRRDLRRASTDPRIGYVRIPLLAKRLLLGTSDEELREASRRLQREELGLTVRHFRVGDMAVPVPPHI